MGGVFIKDPPLFCVGKALFQQSQGSRLAEAILAVSAWYLIAVAQAPFIVGSQRAFRVHAEASFRAFRYRRCRFRWFLEAVLGGPLVLVPRALYLAALAPIVAAALPLFHRPAVAPAGA